MQKIKVQHYSQFLADLIEQKRLVFKNRVEKKVTYQDPCYLGRYNGVYDEPRRVLNSIPGLELVECSRNRADSLCCGGGGGRMWAEFDAETNRLANIRATESLATGAEMMVTACPWCYIHMEDGVKLIDAETSMKITGLAELCVEAL